MADSGEDWDFDFSIYESEAEDEDVIESIHKESPKVSGLRSRFSLGEYELQRIADLKRLSSKYYIEVGGRVQKVSSLWKFYSIMEELWDIVSPIYGSSVDDEISQILKRCHSLLLEYQNKDIPEKVFNNLRYLKKNIYRMMQYSNLGFETDRTARSAFSSAKRKIVE